MTGKILEKKKNIGPKILDKKELFKKNIGKNGNTGISFKTPVSNFWPNTGVTETGIAAPSVQIYIFWH